MYKSFITAEELYILNDAIIIDCRFYLSDTGQGYKEYLENHIPRAIYAHLDEDLSGTITCTTGRHPLPILKNFVNWLKKNGIEPEQQIVVYDSIGGGIAARLWFMLTQLSYRCVAILAGGYDSWLSKGYDTFKGEESRSTIELEIEAEQWDDGPYRLYSTTDVQRLVNTGRIIDSRSEERYLGIEEPLDFIAGRIPGSLNLFWGDNLTDEGNLRSIEELRKNFDFPQGDKVYHCGSGVTACVNLVVAEYLKLPKPAFYPGSWSEWIRHYPDIVESSQNNPPNKLDI